MHSEAVSVNVAACVGIIHTGCEAGSDLDVFLLLLLDKANVPKTATILQPSSYPGGRDLCLFCCLVLLP